jgi:hypothetical protein
MMRVRVKLNEQMEMFFFAVSYEVLLLLGRRRILGSIHNSTCNDSS